MTCTATDANHNTGSQTFTVTVVDTTPPVVTVPPNVTGVQATGPGGAVVSFAASATDIVDGTVPCRPATRRQGRRSASAPRRSPARQRMQVTNTGSQTFTVKVVDTTAPVVSVPPNVAGVQATGPGGAVVAFAATAT